MWLLAAMERDLCHALRFSCCKWKRVRKQRTEVMEPCALALLSKTTPLGCLAATKQGHESDKTRKQTPAIGTRNVVQPHTAQYPQCSKHPVLLTSIQATPTEPDPCSQWLTWYCLNFWSSSVVERVNECLEELPRSPSSSLFRRIAAASAIVNHLVV